MKNKRKKAKCFPEQNRDVEIDATCAKSLHFIGCCRKKHLHANFLSRLQKPLFFLAY
jgi:hypothetical protein